MIGDKEREAALKLAAQAQDDSIPFIAGMSSVAVGQNADGMDPGVLLVFVDEHEDTVGKMIMTNPNDIISLIGKLQEVLAIAFPEKIQ